MKIGNNDELFGGIIALIVAALVSYLLTSYTGIPSAAAAVLGLFFGGGITYAVYRLQTKGKEDPGMTKEEIDRSLTVSAVVAALVMSLKGFGINELFTKGLVFAAEAAATAGGQAAAAAATAGGIASFLVLLAQFIALTSLVFGGVFVFGQKLALWLSARSRA